MKKLALVLALTLTAFAGSAFASDWYSDNVGIYFDEAGTNNCGSMAPMTPTAAYLVLTQVTTPDVNAWELALIYNNVLSLGFTPRGFGAIDLGQIVGEHYVGTAEPMPVVDGKVVVADLSLMVTNSSVASIKVNGTLLHTLPTRVPAFQGSTSNVRELHPVTSPGTPIITINGGCAVETENSSFGTLKGLFR